MANFPFRINIITRNGPTRSYFTSSLVTSADSAVSASDMVAKINLMRTSSFLQTTTGSHNLSSAVYNHGSAVFSFQNASDVRANAHLSASVTEPQTGSIVFTDLENSNDGGLDYYEFYGTKVCSVLGLPEGVPIYTENFKLSDDSSNPSNYLSGDVISDGVTVKSSFKLAPQARVRGNLLWDHAFGEGFLQWVSGSSSRLLMGYNETTDVYSLTAAEGATFKIQKVDILTGGSGASLSNFQDVSCTNLAVNNITSAGTTAIDPAALLQLQTDTSKGVGIQIGNSTTTLGITVNTANNMTMQTGGFVMTAGTITVGGDVISAGQRGYFDGGETSTFTSDRYLDFNNGTQMDDNIGYRMHRPGSITGVSCQFKCTANTGGNVDINVRKNGSTVFSKNSISVSSTGDFGGSATQAVDVDTFAAGDVLTLFVEINGSLTLDNFNAFMECTFDT